MSLDGTAARVWDARTGQALSPPLAHAGAVSSAAFSPDGARVVTASWDQTARAWDVAADTLTLREWQAIADSYGDWSLARVPREDSSRSGEALARRLALERRMPADEISRASNLVASAFSQLPRSPETARVFATEAAEIYRSLRRDELAHATGCLAVIHALHGDLAAARRELGNDPRLSDAELLRNLAARALEKTQRPALAESVLAALH